MNKKASVQSLVNRVADRLALRNATPVLSSEQKARPLVIEALEPRVLFSGSPAPAEPAPAEDTAVQESQATAETPAGEAPAEETAVAAPPEATVAAPEGAADQGDTAVVLTDTELSALTAAASGIWAGSGISEDQSAALASVTYKIADLADLGADILGTTEGSLITLDDDGAGRGWFVDSTPQDNSEFSSGVTTSGIDLLSVLLHEQGHLLGLEGTEGSGDSSDIMNGVFVEGERRLPEAGQADGAIAGSLEGVHYAITDIVYFDAPSSNSGTTIVSGGITTVWQQHNGSGFIDFDDSQSTNQSNTSGGWTFRTTGPAANASGTSIYQNAYGGDDSQFRIVFSGLNAGDSQEFFVYTTRAAGAAVIAAAISTDTTQTGIYSGLTTYSTGGTEVLPDGTDGTTGGDQRVRYSLGTFTGSTSYAFIIDDLTATPGSGDRVTFDGVGIRSTPPPVAFAGVDFENAGNTGYDNSPDDLDLTDGITVSSGWTTGGGAGQVKSDQTGGNPTSGGYVSKLDGGTGGAMPATTPNDFFSWSITIPDDESLDLSDIKFDIRAGTGSTSRWGMFNTSLDGGPGGTALWSKAPLPGRNVTPDNWEHVTVDLSGAQYQDLTNTTVTFYWYAGSTGVDIDSILVNGSSTSTADTGGPMVDSLSPADDAGRVAVDANLVVTFNEDVQKATGDIVIKKSSDDSVVETIAVTSGAVTVSGAEVTIDLSGDLDKSTGYYVEIASGAIEDIVGNIFSGIAGDSTWNFTTEFPGELIAGVDFENEGNTAYDNSPDDLNLADGITVSSGWTGDVINDNNANNAGTTSGSFASKLNGGGPFSWSITIPDSVTLDLTGISFDMRAGTGSTSRGGSFNTNLDGGPGGTLLWDVAPLPGRDTGTWENADVDLSGASYQGLTGTTVTFYWYAIPSGDDIDTIIIKGNATANTSVEITNDDLVITDSGGGNTADDLRISFDGNDYLITNAADGTSETVAATDFTGKIIVNGNGGDDTLTLDMTNAFAHAVDFDGGGQDTSDGDLLIIENGTFGTVVHDLMNGSDGDLNLDGLQVTYTGLEPVIIPTGTVADLVVNFAGGFDDVAILEDNGVLGDGLSQLRTTSGTAETFTFLNPTGSLTINMGAGADSLTIDPSFESGVGAGQFSASLTVDGEAGTDTVNVNTALVVDDLAVTSETINVLGDIDTTAGAVGDVTLDGAVFLGAAVTAGAEINLDAGDDDGTNNTWENNGTLAGFDITALTGETFDNIPTTNYSGIGAVYTFDGTASSGGNLQVLSGGAFDENSTATFEIWFRPTDLSGAEPLFESGGSGSGMSLGIRNDQLLLTIKDGGTNASAVYDLDANNDGQIDVGNDLVQVVGIIDITNNELRLFVNGVLRDTVSPGAIASLSGGDAAGVGKMGGGSYGGDSDNSGSGFLGDFRSGNFAGDLGIIRVYENQALTPEEIAANYAAVAAGVTINAAGNVTFTDTVDSADAATPASLTVNTAGTTTFSGDVGETAALSSLTTDAAGDTQFVPGIGTAGNRGSNLEVHVPLDEVSGGVTPDGSGNGNDGTLSGNAALTTGIIGGAISFDGDNDYITFGDIDQPSGNAFTFATWFRRDAETASATNHGVNNVLVAQSSSSANDNFEIGTEGSNVEIYLDTAGLDGPNPFSVDAGITDGVWHHLVLTYDSSQANEMNLYVDGELVTSESQWGGALDVSNSSPLSLGIARPGGSEWGDFNGLIDETSIWSRALSADEVRSLISVDVTTTGAQTYNDAVAAGVDTILTSTGGDVTFASTLDSQTGGEAASVTVNAAGIATFGDGVGLGTALESLTTDAAGGTVFEAVTPATVVPGAAQNMDAGVPSSGSWTGLTAPVPVDDPGAPGIAMAHDFPAAAADSSAFTNKGVDATFEIWFQPEPTAASPSGLQILWEAGGDVNGSVIYIDYDTDEIVFQSQTASGNEVRAIAPLGEISGGFRQFVGTIDSSTNVISAFVDGQPFGTAVKPNGNWAGGNRAGLGKVGDGNYSGLGIGQVFSNFEGKISSFRYYENQILDAEQIAGNYLALAPATVITLGDQTYQQDVTIQDDARFVGDNVFFNDVVAGANDLTVEVSGTAGTFAGDVSGTGDVVKNGAGTMTITGANTYTGLTRVADGTLVVAGPGNNDTGIRGDIQIDSGGTLQVDSNNRIINTSDITIDAGGTFDLNGSNDAVGNLNGAGSVTLGGGALTLDDLNGNEFSGVISGAGGITLRGNSVQGTQVFSGNNTYSGTTSIEAGNTLQVGSGGTTGTMGTGQVNVSGTIVLDRTDGLVTGQGIDLRDGSLVIAQDGDNEFSGNVEMNDTAGLTTTLQVDLGATLLLSGGNVGMSGTTLNLTGAGDGRIDKSLASGAAAATVIKDGTGTWTLGYAYDGTEGWSGGGLVINNGTIATGLANAIPYGAGKGNVVINANGTLNLDDGGVNLNGLEGTGIVEITGGANRQLIVGRNGTTATFSGTVQDTGTGTIDLRKIGTGTHTFDGVINHDGPTTLLDNGGTLVFDPIGNVDLVGEVEMGNNTTLRFASGTNTIDVPGGDALAVNNAAGHTGTVVVDAGATLDIRDNIGMKSSTLILDGAGTGTISGSYASGGGSDNNTLQKEGAGTWILTNASNFAGGTYEVNDGFLQVDGTIAPVSGQTVTFNVNSGGTATGDGTIDAPVIVDAGGTFSPGVAGAGDIATGDLTFAAGSTYAVDIDGTTVGTEYDQTVVTGAAVISGSTLDLDFGSFLAENGDEFVIIDTTAGVTGEFDGLAEGATLFIGGQTFSITYMGGTDGMDVVLAAAGETGVTVDGTDLVIEDINGGGTTEDTLTISMTTIGATPAVRIYDPNQTLTTNVPGAERPDVNTVIIPLSPLFEDIIIRTNGGADAITVGDMTDFTGSLTVLGGDDFDEVVLAKGASVALGTGLSDGGADENLLVDAERFTADLDSSVSVVGDGTISVTAAGGSGDFAGLNLRRASLTSVDGGITLTGVGGDTGNTNDGVILTHGSTVSTGGGSVTITGTATSTTGANDGISLKGGSDITAGGAGGITLTGTSGGVNSSYGVQLFSGTEVTTAGGDIAIVGASTAVGSRNAGIYTNGATVTAGGAGSVAMTGTGGGAGSNNNGLSLAATAVDAGTSGDVTLVGMGGGGTSGNGGVQVGTRTSVSADGGDVTITGTGGAGTGVRNTGVSLLSGSSVSSGADTSITGVAGTGTSRNGGVNLVSATVAAAGDLTVDGTGNGTGSYNSGISSSRSTLGGAEVTLAGTGSTSSTAGRFNDGVSISRGGVTASGTLTIDAAGGTGSRDNRGLMVSRAALGGTLAVTGSADTGSGSRSTGVFIQNSVLSDDGTIEGTGGGVGGADGLGVYMRNITGGANLGVTTAPDTDEEKGGNYFDAVLPAMLVLGAGGRTKARPGQAEAEKALREIIAKLGAGRRAAPSLPGQVEVYREEDGHIALTPMVVDADALAEVGIAVPEVATAGGRQILLLSGGANRLATGVFATVNACGALESTAPLEIGEKFTNAGLLELLKGVAPLAWAGNVGGNRPANLGRTLSDAFGL